MKFTVANNNPDVRLSEADLAKVGDWLATVLPASDLCVCQYVLGGSLQNADLSFFENHDLTAQTICRTDRTFAQAMDSLLSQGYRREVAFLTAKAKAAKSDASSHYRSQNKQDTDKVVDTIEKLPGEALNKIEDIGSGIGSGALTILEDVLIVVGAVLVVTAVVAVASASRKAA